jgi:SAM-dependent methyltransferase
MAELGGYERCAHLYDLFEADESVDAFMHYALQVDEIIDIGAGTGRVALPMAEAGVKVFAVEPSPAMCAEFAKKLDEQPEFRDLISISPADASSFNLGRTFPAAFMSGCFGHLLDDQERLRALTNIWQHLETGGWLVFDVAVGLMTDAPMAPAGEVTVGDTTYCRSVERKVTPGSILEVKSVYEVHRDGRLVEQIEETSLVGMIDRAGIHRLLGEAGFLIDNEFDDYNRLPYQEACDVLLVEASKRPF